MQVNREMLVLARDSRGLTQAELADKASITQATISKIETGLADITDTILEKLAIALDYPTSFFEQNKDIIGTGIFYRKKQSVTAPQLRHLESRMNIIRFHIETLLASVMPDWQYNIPDLSEFSPEVAAEKLRLLWRLPSGPIGNLLQCIERAHGIIVPFDFGSTKIDAVYMQAKCCYLFFVNFRKPTDRLRFSLAHELGHVALHTDVCDFHEKDADIFASAFLLPTNEIKFDLSGENTVPRLYSLKHKWKVSMQAIIERGYALGCISSFNRQKMYKYFNMKGYKTQEPGSIPPEEPRLIRKILDYMQTNLEYTLENLCNILHVNKQEFLSLYYPELIESPFINLHNNSVQPARLQL